MRYILLTSLVLALAALGACTSKPLTDSAFRGFCYTAGGGRSNSCDNIQMCNIYDSDVLSAKFATEEACENACNTVYNRLSRDNLLNGCLPVVSTGQDWCVRYCQTNYVNTAAQK